MAHPIGFEPTTLCSEDRCSNPLSYGCIPVIIPQLRLPSKSCFYPEKQKHKVSQATPTSIRRVLCNNENFYFQFYYITVTNDCSIPLFDCHLLGRCQNYPLHCFLYFFNRFFISFYFERSWPRTGCFTHNSIIF